MSDQWSDSLRKRMATHKEPSPEGLWEDIELIMDSSKKKKKDKFIFWSKRVGATAAALLFMLFIADYFLNKNETGYYPSLHKENEIVSLVKKEVSIDEKPYITAHLTKKHYPEKKTPYDIVDKKQEPLKNETEEVLYNVEKATKNEVSKNENNKSRMNKSENEDLLERAAYNPNILIKKNKEKYSTIETSFYASNIPTNANQKFNGYGSFLDYNTLTEEVPSLGEGSDGSSFEDIVLGNEYREVYTDIKHKQPIKFGVSVSYNINQKWSVSTGLNYTILSSDLRSGSGVNYYKSEQTLHNIGISSNMNYNIYRNQKISIYLSGGGSVEKNVSGNIKTDYYAENKSKTSRKDKLTQSQLQLSINGSTGIQYNATSKIGLYVEPGVTYYFKNGSNIETIYKEKPLNIDLKVGIRFSLNN